MQDVCACTSWCSEEAEVPLLSRARKFSLLFACYSWVGKEQKGHFV
jgi:hypothetical protein